MFNIHKLASVNGIQTVKAKMIEELKELLEAIEENNEEHIVEEIADVWVSTYQYIILKNKELDFSQMKDYKIKRTLERLGIKECD